jgi:hypothetical protein
MVLALGLSTPQGREPMRQATRVTQKVKEAEPMRSKLKRKGKAKVGDKLVNKAWREELEILKARKAAIQAMIDQLEG